jgi:glycosyltransferase involved in cell wall biosynthesis
MEYTTNGCHRAMEGCVWRFFSDQASTVSLQAHAPAGPARKDVVRTLAVAEAQTLVRIDGEQDLDIQLELHPGLNTIHVYVKEPADNLAQNSAEHTRVDAAADIPTNSAEFQMKALLARSTMFPTTSISIVVPVYRSEQSIPDIARRLTLVLDALAAPYEIILVNDGSSDGSWKAIQKMAHAYPTIRAIDLMRNYGQHNALLAGIRAARYEVIVTIDDDLQNPPEEIPKLLTKLLEGYDVVYGTPLTMQHGLWRNIASRITKLALQSMMGVETASKVNAFRAFRTQLRDGFTDYRSPFVSIDVLLAWSSQRFTSVNVSHAPRMIGDSNYTFRKLITHALNMMTGFSTWPLQMASMIGFAFTLFGLGVLAYVIGRFLILGYSVPGFPFLASIIAIFSGAQLFALGIIGEYLARLHFRMMERPPYVVRGTLEAEPRSTPDQRIAAAEIQVRP